MIKKFDNAFSHKAQKSGFFTAVPIQLPTPMIGFSAFYRFNCLETKYLDNVGHIYLLNRCAYHTPATVPEK
jgi:hypothetical protein